MKKSRFQLVAKSGVAYAYVNAREAFSALWQEPFRFVGMKHSTTIARVLLGALYLIFGLDYFFRFIPYQPAHTGAAEALKTGLIGTGYIYPMMKSMQVLGGLSLLINRYAPFSAVILFPNSLNVFLLHTILVPSGWLMGVLLLVPNLYLGYAYRKYYAGLFVQKAV